MTSKAGHNETAVTASGSNKKSSVAGAGADSPTGSDCEGKDAIAETAPAANNPKEAPPQCHICDRKYMQITIRVPGKETHEWYLCQTNACEDQKATLCRFIEYREKSSVEEDVDADAENNNEAPGEVSTYDSDMHEKEDSGIYFDAQDGAEHEQAGPR
jgi:hypothetical protein